MTIWNLKRLMSFRDNDLKDACLPILAPVIDQIWSVVLANPPGVMLLEYARWQAWQGTGEWTQQNSHLASIPRHICSSFVLPFLLCGLPTSFYAPWLPLFWTTCPTLSSHDHNCYWPWNIHFYLGPNIEKTWKEKGIWEIYACGGQTDSQALYAQLPPLLALSPTAPYRTQPSGPWTLNMVIMFVFIEKTIADSRIPGGQDPTLPPNLGLRRCGSQSWKCTKTVANWTELSQLHQMEKWGN